MIYLHGNDTLVNRNGGLKMLLHTHQTEDDGSDRWNTIGTMTQAQCGIMSN